MIHTNARMCGREHTHIAQVWPLKSGSLLPLLADRTPESPQVLPFPSQVSLSCCSFFPNDSLFLSRPPSLCLSALYVFLVPPLTLPLCPQALPPPLTCPHSPSASPLGVPRSWSFPSSPAPASVPLLSGLSFQRPPLSLPFSAWCPQIQPSPCNALPPRLLANTQALALIASMCFCLAFVPPAGPASPRALHTATH